jgi:phosphomannomutase
LKEEFKGKKINVAISYDSRIKSDVFAKEASKVLASNGIHVYLYKQLMPVPLLSFATRELKCDAGIMVTASHNPSKYNGYKVYGSDGCQITEVAADKILNEIRLAANERRWIEQVVPQMTAAALSWSLASSIKGKTPLSKQGRKEKYREGAGKSWQREIASSTQP